MLERYEIVGRVAAGSTALVWKARDPQLGREVAIKQLTVSGPAMREQMRTEARILAGLDDPNIVAIYDFVEDESGAYIVEEWVDGATLGALLSSGVRLEPVQAVGILHGALSGLAHAHARGIVHRDIQPGNILIDRAGTSKLVDFGLASGTGSLGSSGARAYQSPEALAGQPVTPASDVYSAAALLAHLLKGKASVPPDARGIPEPLATVLNYSLSADPAQRPPTAAELLAWLRETADQTFGAGWLGRASVAALVGAVGAVPIVAIAGAGTAAGVAGAGSVAGSAAGAAAAGGTAAGTAASPGVGGGGFGAVGGGLGVGSGAGGSTAASASTATQGSHSAASAGLHFGKATMIKFGVAAVLVAAAATAGAVALASSGSDAKSVNGLTGTADIYLAGQPKSSSKVDPSLGVVPNRIKVSSGAHTVSFPSVTGKIGCCTDPKDVHGPDGDNGKDFSGTDISAFNGISGVKYPGQTLFLVGVFLGDTPPKQAGQVDLSNANKTLVQAPELGQVFFVGDGHTDQGKLQKIVIPSGAKSMYVGFADASGFSGQPSSYNDNPGKLDVKYQFSGSTAQGVPVPLVSSSTPSPTPSSTPPSSAPQSSPPPSSSVPVSAPPSSAPSSLPPPATTIQVDGTPFTFNFVPTNPDPSEVGFHSAAATIFLHVPQLSADLAQPFVRVSILNEADGTTVIAQDFSEPTAAGGVAVTIPADGDYLLRVTPAGTGSGTVTVSLTPS